MCWYFFCLNFFSNFFRLYRLYDSLFRSSELLDEVLLDLRRCRFFDHLRRSSFRSSMLICLCLSFAGKLISRTVIGDAATSAESFVILGAGNGMGTCLKAFEFCFLSLEIQKKKPTWSLVEDTKIGSSESELLSTRSIVIGWAGVVSPTTTTSLSSLLSAISTVSSSKIGAGDWGLKLKVM